MHLQPEDSLCRPTAPCTVCSKKKSSFANHGLCELNICSHKNCFGCCDMDISRSALSFFLFFSSCQGLQSYNGVRIKILIYDPSNLSEKQITFHHSSRIKKKLIHKLENISYKSDNYQELLDHMFE